MIPQKHALLFLLIFLIGILLINGCVPQTPAKGFLEGKITIGPLCPVERFPPDPRCQPTEETYKAWPIAIWTPDKKTKVAQLTPHLDGTYTITLSPGDYLMDLEKQPMFGKKLPTTFTITAGKTTILPIDIDTGIR